MGDVIEVGGFRGTVDSIGIRTTCLRDGGDNIKVLNNSDIRNLTNLSQRGSTAVCDLPIPYEADLKQARKSLWKKTCCLPCVEKQNGRFLPMRVPKLLGVQRNWQSSAVVLRIVATVNENDRIFARRALDAGGPEDRYGEIRHGLPVLQPHCGGAGVKPAYADKRQ